PQGKGWLIDALGGSVKLLAINCTAPETDLPVIEADLNPMLRARYLGDAGQALYLVRPDQVIAARWVEADSPAVDAAIDTLWEGRA
ncbi:MAG: FAD-dependent oxidoreductase, partial [Paracoccaceae bacterium]